MTEAKMACPKCRNEMQLGYMVDRSHAAAYTAQWAEGLPQKSWLAFLLDIGIKLPKSADRIPIGTFRCQGCGYLESYANEDFVPK